MTRLSAGARSGAKFCVEALAALLAACTAQPPPREPASREASAERWDGSSSFPGREGELVWVGPVLRGFLPESSEGARAAVSERCVLLAIGVPYRFSVGQDVREFVRGTGSFAASWSLEDSGHATACAGAFGPRFSLPTFEQARDALEHRVPPATHAVVWVRNHAGRSVAVRFERVEGGALHSEPAARPPPLIPGGPAAAASAQIYCVAPAAHSPPLEPGDEEIRGCARRARADAARTDLSMADRFLNELEVEKALAERAARKRP